MRFSDGPPLRACGGCPAPANVEKMTRTSHNGIPTGTEYVYRCTGCRREFTIQSPWGIVFGALMGLLVVAGAAAFVAWAEAPGWRWGGSGTCALIALLLLGGTVVQTTAYRRHPIVGMPPA